MHPTTGAQTLCATQCLAPYEKTTPGSIQCQLQDKFASSENSIAEAGDKATTTRVVPNACQLLSPRPSQQQLMELAQTSSRV